MARIPLNLSLPEDLHGPLHLYCEAHFTKPSEVIRKLLVDHLRDEGVLKPAAAVLGAEQDHQSQQLQEAAR
jgi:hypothetical protein